MKIEDFFSNVEAHKELEGINIMKDGEEAALSVRHTTSDVITTVPLVDIEVADWETLEPILTIKDEPNPLYHMSRVVGYFSRIENWNKSKLGELADRQKGSYAIS